MTKTRVYKSKWQSEWQKRKAARMKNRNDLENGVVTGATEMMRKNGITGRPHNWKPKKN